VDQTIFWFDQYFRSPQSLENKRNKRRIKKLVLEKVVKPTNIKNGALEI
jgi:hypothetical protein